MRITAKIKQLENRALQINPKVKWRREETEWNILKGKY